MRYSNQQGILTIATPAKIQTHTQYVRSLLETLSSFPNECNYSINVRLLPGKSNINHARSILLTEWYDNARENDLFLFIDSDQTFTWRDIYRLMDMPKGDVRCMVYGNKIGLPCCHPKEPEKFFESQTNTEVWYAGTGFMMITRPILTKIYNYLKNEWGEEPRTWISFGENGVIPFFKQRIIESEMSPNPVGQKEWLGEDYAFCHLVRKAGGYIHAQLSPTTGHDISGLRYFNPENVHAKKWSADSIVYYCGRSNFIWNIDQSHLFTGSEQAVMFLSREWVKQGRDVWVYCNLDFSSLSLEDKSYYLEHNCIIRDNVHFVHYRQFNPADNFYNIILWRAFGLEEANTIKADNIYVDLHDASRPDLLMPQRFRNLRKVFFKSQYHRQLYKDIVKDENAVILPNGLNVEMYRQISNEMPKKKLNFIWSSCWSRGLLQMIEFFWKPFVSRHPEATLNVLYGNELLSKSHPQLSNHLMDLIQNTPGIQYIGRVSHQQTAQIRAQCDYHVYLHSSPIEIDCISIRENYLTGTIPIISNGGVFAERDGIQIKGDPNTTEPYQLAIQIIEDLENKPDIKNKLQTNISKSNLQQSWSDISKILLNHI